MRCWRPRSDLLSALALGLAMASAAGTATASVVEVVPAPPVPVVARGGLLLLGMTLLGGGAFAAIRRR